MLINRLGIDLAAGGLTPILCRRCRWLSSARILATARSPRTACQCKSCPGCAMIRRPLSSVFQSLEPLPIEGWFGEVLLGPHGGSPTAWTSDAGMTWFGPACQQHSLAPVRRKVNWEPEALVQPVFDSDALFVDDPSSPVVVSSTGNPRQEC